jgi:hypothetical protein
MIAPIAPSQYKIIRKAGLLYFLLVLTAPFSLMYVPGKLMVTGDAATTADNIREFETLLRLGIGSELFHQAVVVFLVLVLYRLFKPVDEAQAKLLVVLGALVSVPIMFLNVVNEIAALFLANGADTLKGFDQIQLDSFAYLFLRLHDRGVTVASVFWGLWLFPFGILVFLSGFIPKWIGYLLFAAGAGYLAAAFTVIVLPQYGTAVGQVALVLEMGELPVSLWFMIKAFRPGRVTNNGRD